MKTRYLSIYLLFSASLSVAAMVNAGDFPKVGTAGPDFCPKDFTSGCTLEAHNFQRDPAKYEQMNAVVLGVSVDTTESHKIYWGRSDSEMPTPVSLISNRAEPLEDSSASLNSPLFLPIPYRSIGLWIELWTDGYSSDLKVTPSSL